jgi:DNA invertase Pin-like site-specific DNA recombinase
MDIGYARVSTLDQNPQLQLDALERAGVDVIRHEKKSGKGGIVRDVQERVLRELKAGDTLTVWKLDRLGRYSFMDLYRTVKGLHDRGVMFRSLTESIDLSTKTGELILILMAWFAETERDIIIERTRAGLAASKANGGIPGGTAPYGFEADHTTVAEGEAELLKEATDRLLVNKHPLSTIVDDWNAREVRTRDGGSWHVTSLRRQLMNPRVVAIIGQERYKDLKSIFMAPDRQKQGVPAKHLLSGILHCALCESPMYVHHPGNGDALVYGCRKGSTSGGRFKGCGQMSISYDQADEFLRDAFIIAATGPMLPELISRHSDAGMEELERALATDRAELEELAHLKGQGRFTIPEWLAMRDPIEARIHEAEAKLASSSTDDVAALRSLPRAAGALRVLWDSWDVPTRRVWLRRLLERVVVKNGATRGAPMKDRLDPEWKR